MQIQRRDQFDQVVIETTGLANPAPIINTLMAHEDMQENIRLDGVVTLVDAKHVEQHLDDEQKQEEAVNEAVEQIAYADRILLNKVDLVSNTLVIYISCYNQRGQRMWTWNLRNSMQLLFTLDESMCCFRQYLCFALDAVSSCAVLLSFSLFATWVCCLWQ